jgi:hypothetical protein
MGIRRHSLLVIKFASALEIEPSARSFKSFLASLSESKRLPGCRGILI